MALFGIDLWQPWGNTMVKLKKKQKKKQEIELAGEDKSIEVSVVIHAHF